MQYTYNALGRRIQKEDKIADEIIQYYYNDQWQVLKMGGTVKRSLGVSSKLTQRWYI